MAATEDDVPQNQSEKVEQEERELPISSGAAIEELFHVEKKVQPVTEEPHETVKTNSQVEIANESISDNLEHRDGEQFSKSPILIEITGEKNSTSSQVHNGKEITNEASMGKSKTNLIAEEGLRYQEVEISGASVPGTQLNAEESRDLNKDEAICEVQEDNSVESQEATVAEATRIEDHPDAFQDIIQEVEITVTGASVPGTQPNAEESRDLNKDEAICVVQEDSVMKEVSTAQTPGIDDHLDTNQDINLEIAKLSVTGNQGADQQNTSNTPTASVQDLHEVGLQVERETDSGISSNLDSKKMEPQGLNSSQNVEDETTEEEQRPLAHTCKFPSEIVCKSDQTEMGKEESQDTEALAHTVHLEDEPTEKIELLRDVSTETEFKGSRCSETTKEVESSSEHTGNVSTETECGKEHRETTEGNPQDSERVIQSTNIDNETKKKVEISPDLAENVSTRIGSRPGSCEMIEGNFEDHTILLHSAILEEETTEKVESLSEHTQIVSIETECSSDPSKVSKSNTQDAEKLSHSVDVQDENIEKAGNLPDFARNVSIDTEDRSNYIEVTKEETSDDVEMNILGAESGEISCEVKSTDDGKEKENLELERSDIGSANVAIPSTGNYSSKSEKEDVENSSYVVQVSTPMISAVTGEILKDVGPENVQEIEAHSGTIFEKEEGEKEDTSCAEPALVKEVPDMVPIVAKENQGEVEKQNMFLEDVATENSTESVMSKAKEMPESSSNDLVMKERETSGKESQEQVLVELLAGEGIHDEVSKGLTEINIEVEVPVKPEIFNTQKDLVALLPKNEPGKENCNEFLQEASGPLQKIDSSQHFERTTSVQEQRSTELLEGDLCEEKDSTSNASKSKADNSLQENTMADGSNKEIDNATAQEAYETEDNDSEEGGAPHPKEDQIAAEVVYKDFSKNEEKEMQIINKDEAMNHEADDIHEGEAVYRNDAEDIKGNDSLEGALELKDQISAEQAERDTSEKDDKKETQVIDEEEVDTALVESSFKEEKLSDHKVTSEITNPEAYEVHKKKVDHLNDNKEIEGNSEEEAPEPKEYQIVAEEDTFNKDEEETKRIIDEQEMATESSITEENKLHDKLETEPLNPEADDVHKQDAFFSNDDEKMKGHIDERTADIKQDQIMEGEAHKDIFSKDEKNGPKIPDKEVAATKYLAEEEKSDLEVTAEVKNPEADEFHGGNEEIKGNNSEEVTKPKDQIAAEVQKDMFSKDEEKEMKMMNKEVTTENLVASSVAKEHESGHKVTAEETIPDADELQKAKADHIKDDEDPKGNDSEEEVPEPNDHIAAEKIDKETFIMDEVKEAQIIDKDNVATEHLEELTEEEDNKSSHEATHPEADDVHKGEAVYRNSDEREPGLRKDQILDEEECQDTFSKDENKDTRIKGKELAPTEYLGESHVVNENKSDHEITTKATNQGGDDEEKIVGNDPEEIAAEFKMDQIAAEEAQKGKICEDAEKETQIIVATEYSVDSRVAEFDKSDDKATNPKADAVDKQEAVYRNNDEKIKGIDSEKAEPEEKYQILAQACKDDEEVAQTIEKREVAIEYSVESIIVEEKMSSHMDKIEVTNPDFDELHKGKADHPNDGEATQGNDPEKVATELNEDHMAEKEAYEDISSKDVEKKTKKIDREKETNEEVSDIHCGTENIDPVDETTQNELQEPVSEDIITDKIMTWVPNLEKIKEEFQPERDFAPSSAEEMKAEDSCEESQRAELNRETKDVDIEGTTQKDKAAYTTQEEEKVNAKNEGNAGVTAGTDRLAEGLSSREYQEQPENYNAAPKTSAKNKVQMLDTVDLAKMQPVEGSLKKEEQDVLESHEKGIKDAGIASIINNDGVTHSAQGRETDIVMQEGNAEVLEEGLPPGEYEEQAANFVTALENSKKIKEEVLDPTVSMEISLKQEEWKSMEPKKETKKLDTAGTTENDDATLIALKCGRGNPEAASPPALKEKMPLRENEKISENSSLVPDISDETKIIMLDATESAEVRPLEETLTQEEWVITEQEKETRELHVECITQEDDAKHTLASFSRMTDTSEEWNEKTLDTKEFTEIRPVEGTLEQEEKVVMEQEKETKDLHIGVITQYNEASHSAEEGEKMMLKHEENINDAGTSKIGEELPPREYEEELENSSEVPELSKQSREKMPDTMEKAATRPVERSLKQDEWDVLEPEEDEEETEMKNIMDGANADAARDTEDSTILTKALPPREYQERAENLNATPKISEQSKEKILDVKIPTEIRLVEENLKQEDWDVMRPEKEEKNLDREDKVQNDEVTLSVKEAEKDTIKQEGHPDDAGTNTLGEELSARKHQELSKTPSTEPDIFNQRNEKMLDTKGSTEVRPVEETLKQEERVVMEQENDEKYSHMEKTTENSEALNTAQECQKETVKHERHLDAAETRGLTEGLGAREYQELAETSIVVPNIPEEIHETILDSIGTKEIKLVEGISKQTEWDVMEPGKETKDMDIKDTIKKDEVTLTAKQGENDMVENVRNPHASSTEKLPPTEYYEELAEHSSVAVSKVSEKDEATLSAKVSEKDTIKTEGNPDDAGTSGLTEELPTRECEELAGNSIVLPDISKEKNEKLLETRESIEISSVEGILKEKEWEVKGQEKETKDLHDEVRTHDDEATYSAKDGENVVRNEENANVADKNRIGEDLIPREHQELAENSSPLLDNSDTSKDKMSEITESTEIIQVEIPKPEEWYVIEPEEKIRNLDTESTKQNDAKLSAQDGEKEMVKLKGHSDARDTGMVIEGLALRECQELPENSIAMLEIPENRKEKILESGMIQGKEGLKQEEWHVMQQEKEIKDLDKGTTLEAKATVSEQAAGKESSNYVGIPDAALTERLTEGLPPREYQELAEKSCIMPNISEERNEITLNTTESSEIKPVEGSSKQEEWDVREPEEKMRDLESDATLRNHEAMDSEHESKMETDRHKGHPDAAGIDRLTEGLPAREYQEQAENSSTGEEWDAIEPEKETKDLDSTTQKDETTLPVGECEKETVKHEGNQDAADTNRLTEGFPPGEYQEPSENPSVVAETSEERDKKIVDAIGSTITNPIEGISKQDKWSIEEPEKETKDFQIEETTQNDQVTHSAREVGNMEIKHQGNANSAVMDRLAEEFPQREYQELVGNFIVVPDTSEEENKKKIDMTESEVIIPVEGSIKPDEWDVLEPQKKKKDVDIEDTIMDKEATDSTLEGEKFTVENEGDTLGTVRVSEGLSQREFKELAEKSSAMPQVSDKSKEKMLDNMEPTEIAVTEDVKEIQAQENLQLDKNTPTPEKIDQEDTPKPEVQQRSKAVDSHSGNTISKVKTLNETDKGSKVLATETHNESHAQEDIDRKDTEVNSSSACTASMADVTVGESPEQLRESMVSEDKPVQAVNETIEDHKKDEDVAKVDTNSLSLLEHEIPHCSPNESTCNIRKKHEVINLEEQEHNTEKAGILLTGTSEHEQINATEETEQNHLMLETGSTQELKAKAQGSSSRDEEKQQLAVDTVPQKTEKLGITELPKSIPGQENSAERENDFQLLQETIRENFDPVGGGNPERSEVKPEVEAPSHWEEKGGHEETTLTAMPRDASSSLHDLLQTSKKDISWVTDDFLPETEPYIAKEEARDVETEKAQNEEPVTDEEGEGNEDKRKESAAYDSPVTVEAPSDIDVKAAQKKSHGILSGVGSKVKQSIKKVKKAITGKSSHPKPKPPSPK